MEQAGQVFLTEEQQAVVDYIEPFVKNPVYVPTLVHGVIGSGKTEVYKKLITACVARVQNIEMRQIFLKSSDFRDLHRVQQHLHSGVFVVMH